MRTTAYLLAALAVLVLAGCQEGKSTSTTTTTTTAAPEVAKPPAPAETPAAANEVTTSSGLKYQDLVVGNGPLAESGSQVTVHYTGWLTDGTKFDSSLDRNQPFPFTIGAGNVIRGWDEGVKGMRVGGKRKLTIPYDLAYGAEGRPPVIPPKATLIFDVELLSVR